MRTGQTAYSVKGGGGEEDDDDDDESSSEIDHTVA
jgi:hypothetical protein